MQKYFSVVGQVAPLEIALRVEKTIKSINEYSQRENALCIK